MEQAASRSHGTGPNVAQNQISPATPEMVKQIKGNSKIWFVDDCKSMIITNPETGAQELQKCKWLEPEDLKVDYGLN